MSRKFCLFAPDFPEACLLDCTRHRHLSPKEVAEGEGKYFYYMDLHPVSHKPRYVEFLEHERSDYVDPQIVQTTQRTHISENVIRNAAGAFWRPNGARAHWTGAGRLEVAARNKVEAYGSRTVEFRGFWWDESGIYNTQIISGRKAEDPKRKAIRVILKGRTPAALDAALSYWQVANIRTISFYSRSSGTETPPTRGPFAADEPMRSLEIRVLNKARRSEHGALLRALDRVWSNIVAGFNAGPHSEAMNSTPGSELPSAIFRETLRAYLNIPSDSWTDTGAKR
jgi:hypothetical protein